MDQEVKGHSGKHSVEVNVRIRKNRDRARTEIGSKPLSVSDHSNRERAPESSKGSWANLLIPRIPTPPSSNPETSIASTQTDGNTLPHDTSDHDEDELGQYIESIRQLHQLCAHLKQKLTLVSEAKDQSEIDLMTLIEQKNRIIAEYQNQVEVAKEREEQDLERVKHDEHIRAFITDVRQLIAVELEEMNRRVNTPLPHPSLHGKFMQDQSWLNTAEVTEHGDGDAGKPLRPKTTSKESASDADLDVSTQYMELPRR